MTTAPVPSTGAAGPAPAAAKAPAAPADTVCCGVSLEYDPEYLLLMARMAPAETVQYGSFIGASAAPDWPTIERDVLHLLDRSRDIALLVGFCRAATRLRRSAGLADGLARLLATLETWPDAVHPQTTVDGQFDAMPRANALAALADREGLLDDIAGVVVFADGGSHRCVRDIAAAFALPRAADAQTPEALLRRMAACRLGEQRNPAAADAKPLLDLAQAALHAVAIDRWAQAHLGDDAPRLQALLTLLAPFTPSAAPPAPDAAPGRVAPARPAAQPEPRPERSDLTTRRSRADMRVVLADARTWFETHEPSSPVAVLLQQAERLVGRRYAEVADALPPELLRAWDQAMPVAGAESAP